MAMIVPGMAVMTAMPGMIIHRDMLVAVNACRHRRACTVFAFMTLVVRFAQVPELGGYLNSGMSILI